VETRSDGENMADQDHKQNLKQGDAGGRPSEDHILDRELDAALARYAAIEPRAGLEDRVLANLRAERENAAARTWWRWPALGAAAAVLIIAAVFLMRRPGKPTPEIEAHQAAVTSHGTKQSGTRVASNDAGVPVRPALPEGAKRPARHSVRPSHTIVANGPRLDHFPSRRPLSDEEKLLVRYVRDFPQDAVMIAQAQAVAEKEMDQLKGNALSEANWDQQ
jgi:hypothetical protein